MSAADWFAALRYVTALTRLAATVEDVADLPGFAAEAFVEGSGAGRAGRAEAAAPG